MSIALDKFGDRPSYIHFFPKFQAEWRAKTSWVAICGGGGWRIESL